MKKRKIDLGITNSPIESEEAKSIIELKDKRYTRWAYTYDGYADKYNRPERRANRSPASTIKNDFDMLRIWKVATGVIKGLNNRVQVFFGVGSVGTDHTIMTKDGTTKVFLNPVRLLQADSWSEQSAPSYSERTHRVQSMIGAAVHELAHTLYTPRGDLLTLTKDYETLRVFRIWEDWYINERVIAERLPGAREVLRDAMMWSSPVKAAGQVELVFQQAQEFETAVEYLAMHMYFRYYHMPHQQEFYQIDPKMRDLMNEVEDLTVELLNDPRMTSWDERRKQYRLIADAITRVYKPEGIMNAGFEPDDSNGGTSTPFDKRIVTEVNGQKVESSETLGELITIGDMCIVKEGDVENLPPELRAQIGEMMKALNESIEEALATGMSSIVGDFEITKATKKCPYVPDEEKVSKLRLLMKARAALRRGWLPNLEEGRIDTKRIARVFRGRSNVFKQRRIINTPKAVFLVLIDASGSMAGRPWELVATVSHELFLALKSNPDYIVHAWSYTTGGYSSHSRNYGNTLDTAVFEDNELKWPEFGGGGTPAHQAFGAAMQFLKDNYPKSQRVILHLSDLGWGDSKDVVENWDELIADKDLRYCTIPVLPRYAKNQIAEVIKNQQDYWHLTSHTVEEIEHAVRDFISAQ